MKRAAGISEWPAAPILGVRFGASRTIGATAKHIATWAPAALKHKNEGWERTEIERVIRTLLWEDQGISRFSWHDQVA
jgi:hypothetical protein